MNLRTIRGKLLVAFIGTGVILILVIGSLGYVNAQAALEEESFAKLEALRETRKAQIELWFSDRRNDIRTLSNSPLTFDAIREFSDAIRVNADLGPTPERRFNRIRSLYLGRPDIEDAEDGSVYSEAHAKYHPVFTQYIQAYGYYDIFLILPSGDIVYTAFKEDDYGTNLANGPYADTNIGTGFRKTSIAGQLGNTNLTLLEDFAYYSPSNEPASFISSPIIDNGEYLGVMVFQIPVDIMGTILGLRDGLGESGETYVVGGDFLFRNDSRFLDSIGFSTTILEESLPVNTVATRSALNGSSGVQVIDDYRGIPVLSAWTPIELQPDVEGIDPEGITWALMAEIDEEEAFRPANQLLRFVLVVGGISILAVVAVAYLFAAQISNPIVSLTEVAQAVAAGDLSQRTNVRTQDEIGILADTFNTMSQQLEEMVVGLEATVAERTAYLQTVAQVNNQIATILSPQRLLQDVADLTKERFELYHSHIYLLDQHRDTLILTAGAGHVGRQMVAENRIIDLNNRESVVAQAARSRQGVIINDVRQSPVFLPHPLLPDTRSELAVALVARGELLGVLDVQAASPGFFTQEVLGVFELLASQIGSALSNAVIFEQAQRTSRHEQAIGTITERMQTAGSVDEILQVAVKELGKALRVPHAAVELQLTDESSSTN